MMSSRYFHATFGNEDAAIRFFQRKGILKTTWACPGQCGNEFVKLKMRVDGKKHNFKCSKCKRSKSLFSGSWLHGMRLTALQVLEMLHTWIDTPGRVKMSKEANVNKFHTITDWLRFFRDVCVAWVAERSEEQIGGWALLWRLTSPCL